MLEAALAAGQGEERIDELALVSARVDDLLTGGSERVEGDVRVGQVYLEEGLAEHERRAQLMGGVGDKASLRVERRFEAGQKTVEGSLASSGGHASSSTLPSVVTLTGWATLFAMVMGVMASSGEFRRATATFTHLAGPKRGRVLAANVAAAAVVGAIFGLAGAMIATGLRLGFTAGAGAPITLSAWTFVRDDLGAVLGAALLAALGVAVGSLIRSQVLGVVGVLIWSVVIEPVIGGLFTAIQPYLPYTAATTLAGATLGSGPGGFHVNVAHGAAAASTAAPLPFAAVVALLGALVAVLSVVAAGSRVRGDIT